MYYKIIVIGGAVLAVAYVLSRKMRVSPVVLRELADRYSDGCDQIIREEMQRGELIFISGRLTFQWIPESRRIGVKTEFYFQDAKGQWVKKMHEEQLSHRVLTQEALAELSSQQTIVFEIEAPEQVNPAQKAART